MTDRKISELVAVTSVDDADEFVLARSGSSNKITGANLGTSFGGGGPVAIVGPYTLTYTDFNDAAGQFIDLGSAFTIGQIVEPFAFFTAYFDGGGGDHNILLGVRNPDTGVSTGDYVNFDSNAPNDPSPDDYVVSGLFTPTGTFPRRTLYLIAGSGLQLTVGATPASGQTRGSIVIYAFVWTP